MPRRSLLTSVERAELLDFPSTEDELIRLYSLSEVDLAVIRQRRGDHNRLGFAVQLCYLRYPGAALPPDAEPPPALLKFIGRQLKIGVEVWPQYSHRAETRREHLAELQTWLGLRPFVLTDFRHCVHQLSELATQTDRGIVIAQALVENLHSQHIILPPIDVLERICSESLTRGTRQVYSALTAALTDRHRSAIDKLLKVREGISIASLTWLRQPPGSPKPRGLPSSTS